jgi:tetratricopeptide (TPR) repeat protein
VAVVPFGARGRDASAGAVARQLARRLVDRFADDPEVELRPVFLVAMPEEKRDAGYLVFGSTPDTALAAGYGRSLGTTHALTGLYRDEGDARSLFVELVAVAGAERVAETALAIAPGALHTVESELAGWLAESLGLPAPRAMPVPRNEEAYTALLEGLDEEVSATLFRSGDAAAEGVARGRAFERFIAALRADPSTDAAEERILVLAAESVERGDEARAAAALEQVVEARPSSWRAQYLLGQLRVAIGEANAAIVALEHSHALHPLRDADLVSLAELYIAAEAPGQASAHLRRITSASPSYGRAQELLGLIAMGSGDLARARAHLEAAAAVGVQSADLELARLHIAFGRLDDAKRMLEGIVARGASPDVLARARRLRLGVERPDLEADLERAGRVALSAEGPALEEAHGAFERVVAFDSGLWEAHFGLGLIARKRDDHPGAVNAFRRVLDLLPEQPDALHELGVALMASGSDGDAVRLLDQAATLRPRDAAYLADAGFAHLRAGDLAAARDRLRMASAIDADDPLTRAYLEELARAEATSGKTN